MKTHGMQNLHLQNQRIQMENEALKKDIKLLRDGLSYFKGFLIDGHDIAANALSRTYPESKDKGSK